MENTFNFKKYLSEGKLLKEIEIVRPGDKNTQETFSTPEELADFLNKHKEEFFNEFNTDVIMYVVDAFGPFDVDGEDIDNEWVEDHWYHENIKNFIKEYWMKPEMKFQVVNLGTEEGDFPIVMISWTGSDTDADMSGYTWFQNTPDVDTSGGDKTVNFLGRKFWVDYN